MEAMKIGRENVEDEDGYLRCRRRGGLEKGLGQYLAIDCTKIEYHAFHCVLSLSSSTTRDPKSAATAPSSVLIAGSPLARTCSTTLRINFPFTSPATILFTYNLFHYDRFLAWQNIADCIG